MPTLTPARVWSDKQEAIFAWFRGIVRDVIEHLVVVAFAGTGKTTTIVEAIRHIPAGMSTLVCAFGKNIELELQSRLTGVVGVTVKTLHALGLTYVKRYWPDVRVNFGSDRERNLAERACGSDAPDAVKKLVAKLCTKGRLIVPHAVALGDLTAVALEFECAPDDEWTLCKQCGFTREAHVDTPRGAATARHHYQGYDLEYVEVKALAAMVIAASEKPVLTGIDGADMLFLPVRNGWLHKTYDNVIVDEAQDMNACQLELALGVCRGRLIVVGDPNQAIYRFAGADSGSLGRLQQELNATQLSLNTTYRCGVAIVREAQRFVPSFEAGPSNAAGSVESLPLSHLTAAASLGDFVLSRVNAPLVSVALKLLRAGKRTRVAGKDIGKGLLVIVRKLKARSVPDLLTKISAWEARELTRVLALYKGKTDSDACGVKLDAVKDQAAMLVELTDGSRSVADVEQRIEALFTDDGLGQAGVITCSSVHKAKGLEASRVFILADTLRDTSPEEKFISYVAITRAKNELVYVWKDEA